MNDETCTISTVDFKERTIREHLIVPHDTGIPQILRSMADYAAKNGVESIIIASIENGNICYSFHHLANEGQAALMALFLEDVRRDLKAEIFNEVEDDMDGAG